MYIHDIKFCLQNKLAMQSAIASNTTTFGQAIDTADFDGAQMFVFAAPVFTDGVYTFTVEESSDVTFATDVSEIGPLDNKWQGEKEDAAGNPATAPQITAVTALDDVLGKIGIFSTKRYIRLKVVSTGVTTGATITAFIVQDAETYPAD